MHCDGKDLTRSPSDTTFRSIRTSLFSGGGSWQDESNNLRNEDLEGLTLRNNEQILDIFLLADTDNLSGSSRQHENQLVVVAQAPPNVNHLIGGQKANTVPDSTHGSPQDKIQPRTSFSRL
jgi:hypothetical protein